jgi:hypothetical protein
MESGYIACGTFFPSVHVDAEPCQSCEVKETDFHSFECEISPSSIVWSKQGMMVKGANATDPATKKKNIATAVRVLESGGWTRVRPGEWVQF